MINYFLVLCGSFALYYAIDFFVISNSRNIRNLGWYTLLLGIGCSMWNFGYAFMGITTQLSNAPKYRRFALIGVVIFLTSEVMFLLYKAGISRKFTIIHSIILLILGVGSVIIWGADDVRCFYRSDGRTLYTSGTSNGYNYQPMYMLVIAVYLFTLWIIWLKHTQIERDKRFAKLLFATNIFTFIGAVLDTFLPSMGYESFPGSPIGSTFTFGALVIVVNNYGKYSISKRNLSKHIYDHEKAGFLTLNTIGRLVAINPYAQEILGISRAENQRISDIFELDGMYDNELVDIISLDGEGEWKFKAKKTDIICYTKFTKVNDEFNEPNCIICSIFDRSGEEEILENIKRSGDAKSSFIASMSHEIRTPINAILGMGEMILRECADDEVRDYAEKMNTSGERLLAIVNNVLDFSKIQSGMMDIISVEYDIRSILNSLIISYSRQLSTEAVAFVYDVDEEMPAFLSGDEVRIVQILKNILDNAVNYTSSGQILFKVSSESISEDEIIVYFEISDTGAGICEEEMEHLFDAFNRAGIGEKSVSGAGIGLAIVYNLVKMMNGSIDVTSERGVGSTFIVRIPQKVVSYHKIGDFAESLEEYRKEYLTGWNGDYTAPAAKVLIVDDNSVNLSVAQMLLERTKAKVDVASSGEDAIELIKASSYQIIFLDHIMPGMDGIETIQRIREEHLADDVPVIALSANDLAGAKEMYLDYGFQDFLAKPISKGSLEKKVFDWIPKSYIHSKADLDGESPNNGQIIVQKYSGGRSNLDAKEYTLEDGDGDEQLTHIFIINPIVAGTEFINEIRTYLGQLHKIRYFIFTSNNPGGETDLTKRVQEYFGKGRLRIYAIGGSGTIRNIINGIEDFERIEVAFCPIGMTSDFMKQFGYDQEKFKKLKDLIRGDVCKIDYIQTTNGIALNTFSLGLDANIVRALDRTRIFKIFGNTTPYALSFLYSLFISAPDDYEVYVDDVKVYEGVSAQIIFGNGSVLGGAFKFAPRQNITDGKGAVMIGKDYQGFGALPSVFAMIRGDMKALSKVTTITEGSKFSVRRRDGGQLAMNFDGEMVYGVEKWDAQIIQKGLNFVVPKGVTVNEK